MRNQWQRNHKSHFIISLMLHLLLSVGVLTWAETNSKQVTPGDSDHNAIDAYFFETTSIAESKIETNNAKHGIALNNKIKRTLQSPSKHTSQSKAASKGESEATLLAMLHNAIQKQQHYPESALEMERQGRVTVKFILLKDGQISKPTIAHSSGTESLDAAALAAIQAAAPFKGVDQFIRHPGQYSIDVVFEMG